MAGQVSTETDMCRSSVMAGLVPAIPVFDLKNVQEVDARDRQGYDACASLAAS
jgi:hypothetical protein